MGGGRGPETLPANCAKGRERGRGDSEEWPTEHTEYTERGARGGSRGNGRGRNFFTTKDTKYTKGGGRRKPEKLPANGANGREGRRGDSEEWPTEHTEYTELGTRGGNRGNERGRNFFTTKDTKYTKGGGRRGPETLPANYAEGREGRRGDSEEWPTGYTNDTKREAEEGGDDGKTKWGLRGCGG